MARTERTPLPHVMAEELLGGQKWCYACVVFHPFADFGRSKDRPDGYNPRCRDAARIAYRKKHPLANGGNRVCLESPRPLSRRKEIAAMAPDVCLIYISGLSAEATAAFFGISHFTVVRLIRAAGLHVRSVGEAAKIAWRAPGAREAQANRRRGKPSGSSGKTWIPRPGPIFKPNLRGEKNPRWLGGKTKLSAVIKNSGRYSAWRLAIYVRDGFQCQECGIGREGHLNCDHIYPFSALLRDHSITTFEQASSCEALWDITNGRTLCHPCHRKTPTYGMKARHYQAGIPLVVPKTPVVDIL